MKYSTAKYWIQTTKVYMVQAIYSQLNHWTSDLACLVGLALSCLAIHKTWKLVKQSQRTEKKWWEGGGRKKNKSVVQTLPSTQSYKYTKP